MLFVVATVLAVWLSWIWGLAFIHWPMSVLSGGDEPQASIIRRVMPHHVIKPEWVTPMPDGELTMPWIIAETKVRMGIIVIGWLACIIAVQKKKTGGANKASDATSEPAPGTVSSSHQG